MRKNEKSAYIQPAERFCEHEVDWLTSGNVRPEVIGKIPYLRAVNDLFGKNSPRDPLLDGQRLVFVADEPEFAEKAAMAFLNLRTQAMESMAAARESLYVQGKAEGEGSTKERERTGYGEEEDTQIKHRLAQVLQSFRELENGEDLLFDEEPEEDGENGAFMIVDAREYSQPSGNGPFDMKYAEKIIKRHLYRDVSLFEGQNAYVDGFRARLCDELIDDMRKWRSDIVIVGMPNTPDNTHARRRLTFEQAFTVIRIPSPESDWYEHLMACSLEAEGLGERTSEEISKLTARLMQHRGSLFREDDIFRFSQMAAEKHRQKERDAAVR